MPNTTVVTADLTLAWNIHDAWTEAYVGVRYVIYELLPEPRRRLSAEALALCQLGLIGANHLMEVGLYRFLISRPSYASLSQRKKTKLRKATYKDMLTKWVPELAYWAPDLLSPPFSCTERLRARRNDTVHKTSARANVPMCRSAIYSSVSAASELWRKSGDVFPYEGILSKYPLPEEKPFSLVAYP